MTQPRLQAMWNEFTALPFPRTCYEREPDGECMVWTDTALSDCVSTALKRPLDDRRRALLHERTAVLARVLPDLADDPYATRYFTHLHTMAALAAGPDPGLPDLVTDGPGTPGRPG